MNNQKIEHEMREIPYIDRVTYQKMDKRLSHNDIESLIDSVHIKMQKAVEDIGLDFSKFTFDRRRERACRRQLGRYNNKGWFSTEQQKILTSLMADTETDDATNKSYEVLAEWHLEQYDGVCSMLPDITVFERNIVEASKEYGSSQEFVCYPYDSEIRSFTKLRKMFFVKLTYFSDAMEDLMPETLKETEQWYNQIGRKMTYGDIDSFIAQQMADIKRYAAQCGIDTSLLSFSEESIKNFQDELLQADRMGYFLLNDRRRIGVEAVVEKENDSVSDLFAAPWSIKWNPTTEEITMDTSPYYERKVNSNRYWYDVEKGMFDSVPFMSTDHKILSKYKVHRP